MKKTVSAVIIAIGLCSGSTAIAAQRCPADDMGCTKDNFEQKVKERVEKGRQDVFDASGPRNKAKAAASTVNDCADCGMKVIHDSMHGNDEPE